MEHGERPGAARVLFGELTGDEHARGEGTESVTTSERTTVEETTTRTGDRGAAAGWRWLTGASLALLLTACGGGAPADAPNNTAGDGGNVSPAPAATAPVSDEPAAGEDTAAVPLVLMAGTSLTAGLGLEPSEAFPALLQRKADSAGYRVRIVNAGLSGETSAGLARRIDWLLAQHAPDVVVVETGANDGLRGLDVDSLGANLRRITAAVRAARPGARLVLVQMEAPPNFGGAYTERFRSTFGAVARESGAELVPFLLEGVAGVRELNQDDAIHPNPAGAALVAATVWAVLEPALASLDPAVAGR